MNTQHLCQHEAMAAGPRFLRFIWPIISTLREFGGSAQPSDVVDRAIEMLEIGDDERAQRTKGGTLRVMNQAHWARRYLVWADLIDGSQRGRWSLTKSGWNLPLEE